MFNFDLPKNYIYKIGTKSQKYILLFHSIFKIYWFHDTKSFWKNLTIYLLFDTQFLTSILVHSFY